MKFAIYSTLKSTPKKANFAKAEDAKPKGLKSDEESGHDSLAAERYKAVKLKTTKFIYLIITGLWISARTAEASPVSFFNGTIGGNGSILPSDFVCLIMDDLDARDEFNRPIQDARIVLNLREIFVASLYQALLARMPLSAEVVDEEIGRFFSGFTKMANQSSHRNKCVGAGSSVAIVMQFFEKLKRYLSFIAMTVPAIGLFLFNLIVGYGWITLAILERQPPVLKPSFEVLRC